MKVRVLGVGLDETHKASHPGSHASQRPGLRHSQPSPLRRDVEEGPGLRVSVSSEPYALQDTALVVRKV